MKNYFIKFLSLNIENFQIQTILLQKKSVLSKVIVLLYICFSQILRKIWKMLKIDTQMHHPRTRK